MFEPDVTRSAKIVREWAIPLTDEDPTHFGVLYGMVNDANEFSGIGSDISWTVRVQDGSEHLVITVCSDLED